MLIYFLIGAALGAGTGIPIGPVNVAVIDTAYRHHLKRAIAVALGGSVADFLYALLGIVVVGPLLDEHHQVKPILYAASGVLLIGYGFLTVRAPPIDPAMSAKPDSDDKPFFWSGFVLGGALIFLNPATFITWVGLVGPWLSGIPRIEGISAAVGVGVGSAVWFIFVAYLADHGKKLLGAKAVWITRVVGIALILFGMFSVARALYIWFG